MATGSDSSETGVSGATLMGMIPRLALPEDVALLRDLLKDECREDGSGFFNNWGRILKHHRGCRLTVLRKTDDPLPVAFAAAGSEQFDMFWVRKDMRRRGIGRHFAEMLLWSHEQRGEPGILLQDVRTEALAFWTAIGFQLVSADSGWGFADSGLTMIRTFARPRRVTRCLYREKFRLEFHVDSYDTGNFEKYGAPLTGEVVPHRDCLCPLVVPCVGLVNFRWRTQVHLFLDDVEVKSTVRGKSIVDFCAMNEIRHSQTHFFAMCAFFA